MGAKKMAALTLGPAFWICAALGIAAAIAYGAYFLRRPPSWTRALVKTAFLGFFTAALISAGAPFPLIVAIVASAFGDFFLAFDKKWTLPLGILSFLIAQLAYVLIFFFIWFFSGDNSPLWPRYLGMAAVIATSLAFLIWMTPKLGWMALGVIPYAIAITAMGVTAMWLPWPGWPATIGAVSFLVSDFVLAAELFRLQPDSPARRWTSPVVWWTYAAAQILIIGGILNLALTGG